MKLAQLAVVALGACGTPAAAITNTPRPHALASTVDEVMDGAIAAVGGRARLEAIETIHTVGTLRSSAGTVRFETLSVRPDRALTRRESRDGVSIEAVNGDLGWRISSDGSIQIMAPTERADMLHDTVELYAADWRTAYKHAALEGTTTFAGEPAYRVALTDRHDRVRVHFFATDTLRELGQESTLPDGTLVRETFSDLRDVGGVRYPFRSTRLPPGYFIVQFERVDLDTPIADGVFAPPDVVERHR